VPPALYHDTTIALALIALVLAVLVLWFVLWRAMGATMGLGRAGYAMVRRSGVWHRSEGARAALQRRFPRTTRFVAARLDPSDFAGLPLTLLIAAGIYLAALFGGLVEDVLENTGVEAFDEAVFNAVAPFRSDWLVAALAWVTDLGASATLVAVSIVGTGFLWTRGPRADIATLWVTLLGAEATSYAGKYLVDRTRPDFVLEIVAYTPSFPSGHTTGAMAVYGISAYVVARGLATPRQRFAVAYWTGVLIALVALSRVFLNVHFASDVLAGLLVGGFWILVGIAVAELTRARGGATARGRGPAGP